MSFDAPDACTLPTAERPLRLAEFDDLFATAVRRVEPVGATHARLHLTGPAGLADRVRDLAARETGCCSFFTFTTTPQPVTDGEAVLLDIEVPAAYADVLAALTGRAVAAGAAS
jgi:hypothetical protein